MEIEILRNKQIFMGGELINVRLCKVPAPNELFYYYTVNLFAPGFINDTYSFPNYENALAEFNSTKEIP
jgi:hypothetical protein